MIADDTRTNLDSFTEQHPILAEFPRVHELRLELLLPLRREDVFPFFSDAMNLQKITPPWLDFRVITPQPIEMRAGTRLDYKLRLRGVPIRWQTEIVIWQPPVRFVDIQRRGPYRLWYHEHTFEERGGRTVCRDHIRYAVPGGPLSGLIRRWLVTPDIERIFAYRQRVIAEHFGVRGAD